MAGSNGGEQNYWPGFVDALSNVVLTLVFVLVVFVFALVITSGKMQQKTVQMVQERLEQQTSTNTRIVEAETRRTEAEARMREAEGKLREVQVARDRLTAELADLRAANTQLEAFRQTVRDKEKAVTPSVIEKRVELDAGRPPKPGESGKESADIVGGNVIVITYPRTTVMLNDSSRAALLKVLETYRARLVGTTARIDAVMGTETYSEGRRMAYYRALDVRNLILEHKLVPPSSIVISTKQSKDPGDARIEIRFVRS